MKFLKFEEKLTKNSSKNHENKIIKKLLKNFDKKIQKIHQNSSIFYQNYFRDQKNPLRIQPKLFPFHFSSRLNKQKNIHPTNHSVVLDLTNVKKLSDFFPND